jgi:DNA polymerase III delta subunit
MIIYLHGPDSYRRQQKLKEIVREYAKKHSSLTIDRFYFDEGKEELVRFEDFVKGRSLFGGHRLAITFNVGGIKEKNIIKLFESLSEEKEVIALISEEKTLNKDFSFLTKQPVINQEFSDLTSTQIYSFIRQEAARRSLSLSSTDINMIAETYRNDNWGIVTELDKLALGGSVTQSLPQASLFQMLFKLQKRFPLKMRISTLEKLLVDEDPAKIFNLLAYQKNVADRDVFSNYDVLVKSGKLDYETVLLDLVIL